MVTEEPTASSFDSAERSFAQGDFGAAAESYRQFLLSEGRADSFRLPALIALERSADIAMLFGDMDRAYRVLEGVMAHFLEVGNDLMASATLLKRAAIAMARSEFQDARGILDALPGAPTDPLPRGELTEAGLVRWELQWIWSGKTPAERLFFFPRFYLESGKLESGNGQYSRSIALLKRGFAHCQIANSRQAAETPIVLALATSFMEMGDLSSAAATLSLLREGIDVSPQPGFAVEEREISARIDLLRGDLGPAKSKLEWVCEVCAARNFHSAYIAASLNLIYVLILLNQTYRATALCEEIRVLALTTGDQAAVARADFLRDFAADRGQTLVSDVTVAPSAMEMQDFAESPAGVKGRSLANPFDLPPPASFLALYEVRALGFYWHLGRLDTRAARVYLEELEFAFVRTSPPTDSASIHVRLRTLWCMLAYYEGGVGEALADIETLVPLLQKMHLKPDLWQLLRFAECCYIRLGRTADAQATLQHSKRLLEAMTATLHADDRIFYLLNKWTEAERAAAAELESLAIQQSAALKGWYRRLGRPWQRLKIFRRVAALMGETDRLRGQLDSDDSTGTRRGDLPGLPRLISKLLRHPRTRVTLSYLVLPDRLLVVRTGWCTFEFGISGVTRVQLRELVRRCHESAGDGNLEGTLTLRTLSQILQVQPALESRKNIQSVSFVPDDVLHGVPFAALRGDTAKHYLIEDFAVSIGYQWLPEKRRASSASTAVAFAFPHGAAGFPPLPEAPAECTNVANLCGAAGMAAKAYSSPSKEELLALLPTARFAHIACHGKFRPDAPSQTGLMITSASGDSATLSLRDLSRIDLSKVEHIYLSSCWSADNFIMPGRRVICLPETLWRAGARVVAASLWRLPDTVAKGVAEKYYAALLAGAPCDRALQQAQIVCARGELGAEFRDPAYWAGLRISGSLL
jgi:hypothetical protein